MILRKVLIDTNLYIGWMNQGLHEDWMVGPGARPVSLRRRLHGARWYNHKERDWPPSLERSTYGRQRDLARRHIAASKVA